MYACKYVLKKKENINAIILLTILLHTDLHLQSAAFVHMYSSNLRTLSKYLYKCSRSLVKTFFRKILKNIGTTTTTARKVKENKHKYKVKTNPVRNLEIFTHIYLLILT